MSEIGNQIHIYIIQLILWLMERMLTKTTWCRQWIASNLNREAQYNFKTDIYLLFISSTLKVNRPHCDKTFKQDFHTRIVPKLFNHNNYIQCHENEHKTYARKFMIEISALYIMDFYLNFRWILFHVHSHPSLLNFSNATIQLKYC